ncbi:unnamed protein product [Rotaria sp. Silwood1]|nr:unnamed protein product [Rotaria sp. Silwood1]
MQLDPKQNITFINSTQQNVYLQQITPSIRFNIFFILGIPSFIAYTFIIIYTLTNKNLRSAPNNYCLLILLIVELIFQIIDLPLQLYLYHQGKVLFQNATFCFIWRLIDYSGYAAGALLLAWASFERHILIFHDRLLRSKWKNIYLHYAPPFIIIVYVFCFYIYALSFCSYKTPLNFQSVACGNDCIRNYIILFAWGKMVHQIAPSLCIGIFSVSLLIRVLYSKRRLQQAFSWRKHSKMAYQLLSISFVCNAALLPYGTLIFLNEVGVRDIPKAIPEYLYFFATLIPLYLPFVYLTSLSEVWARMKSKVHPTTTRQTAVMKFTATKTQLKSRSRAF